jgi:hypothetical protein
LLLEFFVRFGRAEVKKLKKKGGRRMEYAQTRYLKIARAVSDYQLEVLTETDTHFIFDFRPKFKTVRFMALQDRELFMSAHTDGNYILFEKEGCPNVKISAPDMMELALVNRKSELPEDTR